MCSEKSGLCTKCEWYLARQEWCLAKGVVPTRPSFPRPCRFFSFKVSSTKENKKGTKK